jgi:hypothetical protein
LFIAVRDSAILLLRLMASVIVCKLIIMYELSYLQVVVGAVDEGQQDLEMKTGGLGAFFFFAIDSPKSMDEKLRWTA